MSVVFERFACMVTGGHSWQFAPGLWDDSFCHFCKKVNHGYRQNREDSGSPAGAVPAGPSGECPGGTVAPAAPSGESSLSPEPVNQEILAWRGWHWESEPDAFGGYDLALRGFNNKRWDGPVLVADQIPTEENKNGIYARPMDWFAQIMSMRYMMATPFGVNCSPVQGLVALSGRVLQGEMGWRAERAAIRELWIIRPLPVPELFVRSVLEDRYKCDIHWHEIPEKIFPAWHYA